MAANPSGPRVGERRKGSNLPRLPLSAFSPPNSSADDKFPLPPSPKTTHPDRIVDANVFVLHSDHALSRWKSEAGPNLSQRIDGLVLSMPEETVAKAIQELPASKLPILSVSVPFSLENAQPKVPDHAKSSSIPISLCTVYKKPSQEAAASLRWALEQGLPVDIDVQADISEANLEAFEDLITKASEGIADPPAIVLTNILPPPHDLGLPMVKLMAHPTYQAFETQIAALSLFPNVYIKFLPPCWNAPTPPTPHNAEQDAESADAKQKREWKRRIKMYLGPVIEAFGYQRVIFGSSASPVSQAPSHAGDWYELARESLGELSGEQEFIDGVFCGNAKRVYGEKKT